MAQQKAREVFNDKNYCIPNYQRDYAWKTQNLEDLWEDLLEAKNSNDDMGHFLGTIVVAKKPDSEVYDIIDGQQRATTIFMLRYALNAKTKDPQRNINHFYDDDNNLRLQVSTQNRDFFAKLLKSADNGKLDITLEKEAKTEGQTRLYKVFSRIWDYVNILSQQAAKDYLDVLNKMIVMCLEEKDSGRAIRTFQSVNDRGVPLSILDKLKALLILYSNKYCQGELDKEINERFGEIFKYASEAKHYSFLGGVEFKDNAESNIFNYHALGIKDMGHYKNSAEDSYKKIKEYLKNTAKALPQDKKSPEYQERIKTLQDWLDWYSKDLNDFFKALLEIIRQSDKSPMIFKLFYVLKINTILYTSLVRCKINNILDDELLELFAKAQMICFGWGDNRGTALDLCHHADNKEQFKKKLIEISKSPKIRLRNGVDNNLSKTLEDFPQGIFNDDKWNKYFHYFFLTYHSEGVDIEVLKKLNSNKTYNQSIEHIIPQGASKDGSFKTYGFDSIEDFERIKNDFGNLLILPLSLNSAASDNDLVVKQKFYKESKIPYIRSFASTEDFLSFNKESIRQENAKFAEWLKTYFKEFL